MKYKMVDLFAGCGGLSLGMEQAGFTPWFVNEIVETFCNTYKRNHTLSDGHYFVGDINELNEHLDEYEKYWKNFNALATDKEIKKYEEKSWVSSKSAFLK